MVGFEMVSAVFYCLFIFSLFILVPSP